MAALIVLSVLMATIYMPQAAAQACSASGQSCTDRYVHNCCGGLDCYGTYDADFVTFTGTCRSAIFDTVVTDALGLAFGAYIYYGGLASAGVPGVVNDITTANNALATITNVPSDFVSPFGSLGYTYPVSVTDIAGLGSISVGDMISIVRLYSTGLCINPDVSYFNTGATDNLALDHIFVGNVTHFAQVFFSAVTAQPSITFGNLPGFDPALFAGVATISVGTVANLAQGVINALGTDYNAASLNDIANIVNLGNVGSLTVSVLAGRAGFNLANTASLASLGSFIGSITLADYTGLAGQITGLINSFRTTSHCTSNADCCSGNNCAGNCCIHASNAPGVCCAGASAAVAAVNFKGISFGTVLGPNMNTLCNAGCPLPCAASGSCTRASDCCSGSCCPGNSGGHGKGNNCNVAHCNDGSGKGNCNCAPSAK